MKNSLKKRVLPLLLAVVMLVSLLPMSVFATETDEDATTPATEASAEAPVAQASEDGRLEVNQYGLPGYMTVIQDDQSTLAPGITERQIVVYDANGNRVEMFVAVLDTAVETASVYANYKNNQNDTLGMQKTTVQAAAFEANHEGHSVVVAINASYYNTASGKPTGAFAMEGNDITSESEGNAYPFFAVLKDGTYMIGAKGEYSAYKGQIKEAIGGYIHLVKDGEICAGLDATTKYPRQTVGITADGRVIVMTADGLQAPKSDGLTVQEQAEVMLAMGCVEALHLDGGASATYCSKAAGIDTLEVVSSPSGTSEREVSNSLIFVSTAKPDGTFDRAVLTAENTYVTPGAVVSVTAAGVDSSGGPADIPAEGISWQLADPAMGIVENGVFTSNGTTGTAKVQMVYNGEVVGEVDINVVIPTAIAFDKAAYVAPFGKTISLVVKATVNNGVNEVVLKNGDVTISVSDTTIGSLNGFDFTATSDTTGATSATLTATFVGTEITATAGVTLGKGSEIVIDFEDYMPGDKPWTVVNGHGLGQSESGTMIVTDQTGKVRNGDQALAIHMDATEYHYYGTFAQYKITGADLGIKNLSDVSSIGFWIYVPEEAVGLYMTLRTFKAGSTSESRYDAEIIPHGYTYSLEREGWYYCSADFSDVTYDFDINLINLFMYETTSASGNALGFYPENETNLLGRYTLYIDDITIDYSDAVEDREVPEFGDVLVSYIDDSAVMDGQTITYNTPNVSVQASEHQAANAVGLDISSAKAYIDGVPVTSGFSCDATGKMMISGNTLNNGYHSFRFEISDANGNTSSIERGVTINAVNNGAVPITIAAQDPSATELLVGSIYWLDMKAANIENIQSVTTTIDLDGIHDWVLDYMEVADGFTATYSVDRASNDATITVTRTGDVTAAGENVLASLPVHVWEPEQYFNVKVEVEPENLDWNSQAVWEYSVKLHTSYGVVTYMDNTTDSFAMTPMDVATETNHDDANAFHIHMEEAVEDKAATCTEDGYTGRTVCVGCTSHWADSDNHIDDTNGGCGSIVNWGTKVPANGHTYKLVDGVVKCGCGETFTGTWEDGKDYVDGVAVSDGWNGEYYYVDGVKLTGVQKVAAPDSTDEFYYNFGEDGVCKGKYEGLFLDETASVYRYAKLGVLTSGWQTIDDEWYYFDSATMAAATGTVQYTNDITYEFDETGKLTKGCWVKTLYGTRYYYGPAYHKTDWLVVDGNTYFFQNGYRLEGYRLAREYNSQSRNWYNFGEDGILVDEVIPDGFYDDAGNGYSYVKDGVALSGENVIDGVYYYFDWKGYAKTGYQAGRLYGDDYKAVSGIIDDNGVLRYYRDGKPKMGGLVEVDGAYYFAYDANGEVAVNETRYVWQGNGIVPESNREFGADGKLLDGIVEKDGTLYYYDMGQGVTAGLVEVDGAYYFAYGENGEIAANEIRYVWQGNGIITESECEFGADGKLLDGVVQKDDGYYYYVMGQPKMAGLIYIDGHYYFAKGEGKLVTGKYYVWQGNDLLPEANYIFAEDGKMLDGIVEKEDGLYYYVNGMPKMAGLIEFDGALYFAGGEGKLVTGRTYYVWQGNGILPESNREFGADGKMLDGIVEKNGILYHYVDGQPKMAGMVEIDGAYYFAYGANGEIAVDEIRYVWQGNGIVPESNREFGADGKLLDGIIEKDGTLYYYVMGQPKMAGMIELDGAYYFVYGANGEVAANETRYVWQGNGIVNESSREFGADGKLLNGIVEKDDGYYYYEMGEAKMAGLVLIDGYYYFAGAEGKLVTNRTYYVWKTNGLTMEMNYTFDALGRIVL